MANITYNRIIRKITLAFGDLFNKITMVRYNLDETEQERLIVPIAYGTKELYVSRLEGDPDLDKQVQVTLPRFSYILNDISYDSSRKLNTNVRTFARTNGGGTQYSSQYNPVPYDLDYTLYLYVRNIEDGAQLVEHILPYFTPDYTIRVDLIEEMGITKEIPLILKTVSNDIVYEGNRDSETRYVVWTLNFTAKAYIYGKSASNVGLTRNSIANIYDYDSQTKLVKIHVTPTPTDGAGNTYANTITTMEFPNIVEGLNVPTNFDGDALVQVGVDDLNSLEQYNTDLN
jgi:hypothetical protein